MRRSHEWSPFVASALTLALAACGAGETGTTAATERMGAALARAGKTIRVPQDQPTIAAAMAAAAAGDTVKLAPGTYREILALKSGVKVVGGPSTIDATGLDHGITGDATVTDAIVSGISVLGSVGSGIALDGSAATLRQVTSRGSGFSGLLALNGARVSLSGCELSGNATRGLNADLSDVSVEESRFLDNGAAGIGMTSSRVKVSGSLVRGNGGAANVRISYGSTATLEGNQILGVGTGVLVDDGFDPADPRPSSARLSGNVVSGNGYGVQVQSGRLRSESDHLDGNWFGLYAHGPVSNLTFEGTTFDANSGFGIYATSGAGLRVEGGTVSHNGANGVHVLDADFECATDDCTLLRLVQGTTVVSLAEVAIEGNAWAALDAEAGGRVSIDRCALLGNGAPVGGGGVQTASTYRYDLGDGVPRTIELPGSITVRRSRIEGNVGWCAIADGASTLDLGGPGGGGNTCVANGGGVANVTFAQQPIPAEGNWWGTSDGAAIAAMMYGPVDFVPFLTAAP